MWMTYSLVFCWERDVRKRCLLWIRSVINYYTSRGSPIFVASLDAIKAFDRVNHYALFHKLLLIGIPITLLNVLTNSHLNVKGVFYGVVHFPRCFVLNLNTLMCILLLGNILGWGIFPLITLIFRFCM